MEDRLQYLFKRYIANTCTQPELDEFLGYMRKAEHDEQVRVLLHKLYHELAGEDQLIPHVNKAGELVLGENESVEITQPRKLNKARLVWLSAAAMLVVALTLGFVLTKNESAEKQGAVSSLTKRSSNRSESKILLLADSTQVWLNAASSLEFPDEFDKDKREVYLSGEAFFEVKHADKIPFIIHTGNVKTTVLGTAFNIKAYPGERNITISVSRGKVKVTREDGLLATLTRGQELKVQESGSEVKEKPVLIDAVASWQNGNIVYDDETLADIIADMQRVYNVNIVIGNESIKGLKISTSFKREIGVEQALQVLCKLTDTNLRQTGGSYIII